jgi:hypothetical protein
MSIYPTPICFEDGNVAHAKYNVPVRRGGPCPRCNAPIDTVLAYNPFDNNYYFNCGACQKWFRYCDINGNLLDLMVVTTNKKTEYDENLSLSEFSNMWGKIW